MHVLCRCLWFCIDAKNIVIQPAGHVDYDYVLIKQLFWALTTLWSYRRVLVGQTAATQCLKLLKKMSDLSRYHQFRCMFVVVCMAIW